MGERYTVYGGAKHFFIGCTMRLLILLFLLTGCAATAQLSYDLELTLNGESIPFEVDAPASLEGGTILLGDNQESVVVTFNGGSLELNVADWNTFDYAHVLATQFQRTDEDTYSVSATVRHNDTGWDNYADAFEVKGENVKNGERILLHPHENEQPFTRSQSGVVATGEVYIEAKDNVEGLGGSTIHIDLGYFEELEQISIAYSLTKK